VKYYLIETDWDETHNSPWDAVWHDLDWRALICLRGSLPLAAIWKSPPVRLERRRRRPDVFGFELHYAVTPAVRDLLVPLVKDEAEFLPLDVPGLGPLFVVHPLWPVDFDDRAEVSPDDGGNITVVRRYSFTLDPAADDGPRHLFRMRQAKGSEARDSGLTLSGLIASEKVKRAAERAEVRGIVFKHVCSA
jgi:hypothetical protein